MDINNQLAIVIGGASGLGAETVRLLAENGAKTAIFDTKCDAGEALSKEVNGHFYEVDVRDESEVRQALADCREKFGYPPGLR
jgi:NAD(P)-dependent dehydrogenase (short-subunit alcohol dehydrogenase family)